jgi:biotin carboxyl carrier protein
MAQETVEVPIPGKIVGVQAKPGQAVSEGDILCTLESMKMENPILSPTKGVVKEVKVAPGQFVNAGDIVATVEY